MLSPEVAMSRVAIGAAHLDQVRPGWHDKVDVGRLELHSGCYCVLGQLNRGTFDAAAIRLRDDQSSVHFRESDDLVVHGFALACPEEVPECAPPDTRRACYQPLQDAWIDAIAERRLRPWRGANAVPVTVRVEQETP